MNNVIDITRALAALRYAEDVIRTHPLTERYEETDRYVLGYLTQPYKHYRVLVADKVLHGRRKAFTDILATLAEIWDAVCDQAVQIELRNLED